MTTSPAPVAHLEECSPEEHQDWRQMPYRDALELGAAMCPDTQYMANELFAEEMVWVGPSTGEVKA